MTAEGPMTMRSLRQRTWILAVALGVLLLSACGTRLSDTEAAEQLSQVSQPSSEVLEGDGVSLGGGDDPRKPTGDGGAEADGSGVTGAASVHAGNGSTGTTGGVGNGARPTGSRGTAGAPTGNAGGGGGAGGSGPKKAIVIGMVGNFSGVFGAVYAPARDAALGWAQATNAKGGIDGHPIKLLVADNGNSGSNDIAAVRRLVEQEGVIAIVNFFPAAGGADSVGKYAQEKGVAIVGGSGVQPAWNRYLTMFPATTGDVPQDRAWAVAMKERGLKKVGSIHCSESPTCAEKQAVWADAARKLGLQVVYQGNVSLAQPDFTSACTEARSRGAEAMVTIVDGNSTQRYARDCARQQYKHLIVVTNPPNEVSPQLDGSVAPIGSFPWFLTSGTPALEQYGAAMSKYTKKINTFSAAAWTHGKMFEKALTGKVSDTPTREDVLNGLYSFRGETLGGLSQPLMFARGKPAPVIPCAWKAVATGGKWTAPAGLKATYC